MAPRADLAPLERRIEIALQAATVARPPAPAALSEILIDALARLRTLPAADPAHGDAVETIERALAALEAWQRITPSR